MRTGMMRGEDDKGQQQDDVNTAQYPGMMQMGEQQGGNKEGGTRMRGGEWQQVGAMMTTTEHTTQLQPHEQLLIGWATGGMMMTPMTAPWTTTTSHCLWDGKGYGCTRQEKWDGSKQGKGLF